MCFERDISIEVTCIKSKATINEMASQYNYDWNSHPDQSLHSVHGQVHAGPHSIPTHSDNGQEDSGAFVAAGTAGQQGFDVRTLGLTEQELQATGLHPSMIHQGRQLPLDQYKINYDPNPIIIRKQIPIEMPTYKQQVIVRYLRPPTPPSPGPLIIKEVREAQPAAAPPLVIRTRAPREKTPPPIVIREAPPPMPHVDRNPHYVTRVVRQHQQQHQQMGPTFNNVEQNNWFTEVVSDNGATSAAPPHLLDDIYRAFNNQYPRV